MDYIYLILSQQTQVTIELKNKLASINVTVQVKTFEEDEGIAGLGDDPFVSVNRNSNT